MGIWSGGVMAMLVWAAVGMRSGQGVTAADVLARSRAALGVEDRADLTALRMEGNSTRLLGPLRIGGAVDLRVGLPDRYLRVDVFALSGIRGETAAGFNRDKPIQRAIGPEGMPLDVAAFMSPEARAQALRSAADVVRHDLRLLLLGFFADAFDSSPVVAEYGGMAEAPDGRAHAVALTLADASRATLFLDSGTLLPRMVAWQGPDVLAAARAVETPSSGRVSTPAADLRAQLDVPVEHRWYFGDYRSVGGRFRWPFVLRRSVGGTLIEELRLDTVTVNPVFDASLFDTER